MNTLTINISNTDYGSRLWSDYLSKCNRIPTFFDYLQLLDINIIQGRWASMNYSSREYLITFKDEQSKMFFILKYA